MFRLLEHASKLHDTSVARTYGNIGIQYNRPLDEQFAFQSIFFFQHFL